MGFGEEGEGPALLVLLEELLSWRERVEVCLAVNQRYLVAKRGGAYGKYRRGI